MKFENYYKTRESVMDYTSMAKGYDGRLLINKLKKHLPAGSCLLEVGMGPGVDLDLLKAHYQVTGSDFSQEFLTMYRDKNPHSDLLELDAISLGTDRKFDAIYSNKVLHHLTDHELTDSFQNQYRILTEKGVICHSFWKGSESGQMGALLFNYHLEEELREIVHPWFEVICTEVYTELEKEDSILLIGRKNPKNPK